MLIWTAEWPRRPTKQRCIWRGSRRRVVEEPVRLVGDKPLTALTRASNSIISLLQLNEDLAKGLVAVIGCAVRFAIFRRLIDVDERHVAIPSFPLIDCVAMRIIDAQPIVVRDVDEQPVPL